MTAFIAFRKGAINVGSEEGILRGSSLTGIVRRALETRYVRMLQSLRWYHFILVGYLRIVAH